MDFTTCGSGSRSGTMAPGQEIAYERIVSVEDEDDPAMGKSIEIGCGSAKTV